MARPKKGITTSMRFWARVRKTATCWVWTGCRLTKTRKNNLIYGVLKVGNKNVLVHRLSYEMNKGAITAGLKVCHSCDNPLCVNPDHLFEGTQKANVQDCKAKGRRRYATAATPAIVRIVRLRYEAYSRGPNGGKKLAKELGLSQQTIADIVAGRRHAHVS